MAELFKNLQYQAFRAGINPRTKESRDWFRKKTQELRRINRSALLKDELVKKKSAVANRTNIGSMFMFFYEAKNKDTLPYYDKFPLIIMVGPAEGGFYGINLHYLSPVMRAKFLDALLDVTSNNNYDESTKFRVTYNLLSRSNKFKYFKPCFKHYLKNQVRSSLAEVQAPEWEIATFLPMASWNKGSSMDVYAKSRSIINR